VGRGAGGLLRNEAKKMKFKTKEEIQKYADEEGLYYDKEFYDPSVDYAETIIINPENKQHLIYALIEKEEAAYESARQQLTITSSYHDWHNTIADKMADIANRYHYGEDEEEDDRGCPYERDEDELIAEWNENIDEYNEAVETVGWWDHLTLLKKDNIVPPEEIGIR